MHRISAILITICLFSISYCEDDLYRVLGVGKWATNQEIKKAYKQLAKEWHPDKNQDPRANEKFMKINEAYETLSDPEKRENYDNFGTTSAQNQQHPGGGGQPFNEFFRGGPFGGFKFHFNGGRGHESSVEKYRITIRAYTEKVFPQSVEMPYIIYAYSDFCYHCMQVEMIWDSMVNDMKSIGMGIASMNAQYERGLTHKLGISSTPSIIAVVNRRVTFYSGRISLAEFRDFIRSLIPKHVVTKIDDTNVKEFLNGWSDNKVRVLFFSNKPVPSLRFVLPAYMFRHRAIIGYVVVSDQSTKTIRNKYNIGSYEESMLIFHEDTENPVARISMKKLERSSIDDIISRNKYLTLPRLSSQEVFNELCPPDSTVGRKKLCIVMLARRVPEQEKYVNTFRDHAQETAEKRPDERVSYAYVYEDTQPQFVKTITRGKGALNTTSGYPKVAVIWRKEPKVIQYDWLEEGWNIDSPDHRRNKRRLAQLVDWMLSSKDILPFTSDLPIEFYDEHALPIFWRILQRISDWVDSLWYSIRTMDDVTIITLGTSVMFVVVIGLMMKSVVNAEDERINRDRPRRKKKEKVEDDQVPEDPTAAAAAQYSGLRRRAPVLNLPPMTYSNYETLMFKNEPGVRTIIILVDHESRHRLLQKFAEVMYPYSRSRAFVFAFMHLEDYLPWYKDLLERTLDWKGRLTMTINMRNCIGTVLAINGPRKYYCIYHPRNSVVRKHITTKAGADAKFLGFDDSESDTELDADKLFESDLLAGLALWMDALENVPRLRIDKWPAMS